MGIGYFSEELESRFSRHEKWSKESSAQTMLAHSRETSVIGEISRCLGIPGWKFDYIVKDQRTETGISTYHIFGMVEGDGAWKRLHPDFPSGENKEDVWTRICHLALEKSDNPTQTRKVLGLPVSFPFKFWAGEGEIIARFEKLAISGNLEPVNIIVLGKWDEDQEEFEIPFHELSIRTSVIERLNESSWYSDEFQQALDKWFRAHGTYDD